MRFMGNSEEFNEAVLKLKQFFTKGSKYNFDGCEIIVNEDTKAAKTTAVLVSTGTIKGSAGIRFYSSKESGESVVVCKQSKEKYLLAKALAFHFVKVILEAHLNKTLTDEFVKQLKIRSNNKTIGKQKVNDILSFCDKCDYVSKNEHGLNIHKGKRHTDIIEPSEPNTPAQKPAKTTQPQIHNNNFGKFICPTCGLRC